MKNFWKKYKVFVIVIIAIVAFVGLSMLTESSRKVESGLDDFKAGFPKDDYSITVIGLTYCGHCHNFSPIIRKVAKEYNLPLYWFDYDALSKDDTKYITDIFSEHGYEGYSPYMAVAKKGEVIATHTGEMDENATVEFLKENKIIK